MTDGIFHSIAHTAEHHHPHHPHPHTQHHNQSPPLPAPPPVLITTSTPTPPLADNSTPDRETPSPKTRVEYLRTAPKLTQHHSDTEVVTRKFFNTVIERRSSSPHPGGTDNESDHNEEEHIDDLLDYFKHKQSEQYRTIQFKSTPPKTTKKYTNQVSFNEINLQCDDDDEPEWDDALGWELFMTSGGKRPTSAYGYSSSYARGRDSSLRSPSPGKISPSPLASPTRRSGSGGMLDEGPHSITEMLDSLSINSLNQVMYPTERIVTHRCASVTKRHRLYDKLYKYQLYPLKPILPNRTILVFLSGRKHTWVALDWILQKFIENGDNIIVVSAINSASLFDSKRKSRRGSSYTSPIRNHPTTPIMRFRQRTKPENLINITNDIMSYIMQIINPNIIAKITVEIVAGKTKDVLKEMYHLYEPNLVCTGTKPNSRTGAPLKSWNSSKLTDRLVKNFTLPVIVVPAVNMGKFELDLQKKMNEMADEKELDTPSTTTLMDYQLNEIDEQGELPDEDELGADELSDISRTESEDSINSHTSTHSSDTTSSVESYDSYDEISRLYMNYKQEVSQSLKSIRKSEPLDEEYYLKQAKLISDKSAGLCHEIMEIDPDFRGQGSKLARMITGSNSFGIVPYKTKSLLDPVNVPPQHKMSFKQVQEQLKRNRQKATLGPPEILIQSPASEESPSLPPHPSALKFVEPSRNGTTTSSSQKKDSLSVAAKNKGKSLYKSLSYDVPSRQPELNVSKSHPDDLKLNRDRSTRELVSENEGIDNRKNSKSSSSKKKSKKKSKFWSLFK
ncbi:uncharacterized protein J8A68_001685 [[Candida] subhashii]|uniref:UspA domain-containing protein n=1 Tax=[Candida] subhashii TaxID=561895 RepID=A0A8J5UJR7_9ASCO|nr:uncharacterized protein J8A68_001685 [[Candida] subhashii]KAG7664803.1 hypothetical protein J8A68_001685 [[Candida] subhashii]